MADAAPRRHAKAVLGGPDGQPKAREALLGHLRSWQDAFLETGEPVWISAMSRGTKAAGRQ